MARTRNAETYVKQSAVDIVKALARKGGLTAEVSVQGTATQQEWSWRTDSVLGQVDELCERAGWEWVVSGSTLRVVDVSRLTVPASTCTLTFGADLLRFSAEQSRPVATEVTVRGWNTAEKTAITAKKSTPTESGGFAAATRGNPTRAETVATRLGVTSQGEADGIAGALAAAAATVTARGRALFAPLVEPGKAVTIAGAGPGDGTYYVREVEHVYDGGPLRTTFVAGFRPPTLVSDPWTARRPGGSALTGGTHTGLVTDTHDPQRLGRVRVKLGSVDERLELDWARVVSPGGGKGHGIQWLPEVNDEVLVAFEDGDPRRPVVIGGLFNAKDTPPHGEHTVPVKTRSMVSRVGHKIELEDGDGTSGHIDLVLADGKVRLHLDSERIDLETADKPVRIASGGGEILFDGRGNITIKGTSVKVEATQDVALQGVTVKTKASSAAEVEGATTTIKANASLKLQSSGIAELAGSMVKIN